MHVHIVMNHSGDSRHLFNPSQPSDVAEAASRFDALRRRGFSAVGFESGNEQGKVLHRFDPSVERTLFIPQLRGG